MKSLLNTQKVVAHPETGEVITYFSKMDSEGVEKNYGKVRIDEEVLTLTNGYLSPKRRTAFITLDDAALRILSPYIKEGQPYPMEGKIIITESLEPQYEGQDPKLNPSTGKYITSDGFYIYRSTEFTTNLDAKDKLIQYNSNIIQEKELEVIEQDLVI
ncbi:hypothetical protein LCM02_12370 [Lutimonas saemankumensis]|uniref:hypothetical protein n=1 Tax=Lutimonas saemankumensis TaxID=483016 RepID=UPI001CD5EC60|nr:hypothetical protein [Lutimonas saemankumensis]MCA0933249.1 hypothetical protein [Lutimonas saemankumensis]